MNFRHYGKFDSKNMPIVDSYRKSDAIDQWARMASTVKFCEAGTFVIHLHSFAPASFCTFCSCKLRCEENLCLFCVCRVLGPPRRVYAIRV